ncbi:hypothetical protein ACH9L7_15830 [Haloferax sp. S1W]|uniref:hypothetical protein n=1 Tax=Haloferax sp. S1W TaxID=3377110 RepID=UPI0037C8E3C8
MVETEYDVGEPVPVEICPEADDGVDLRFAVPVEVYRGYGTAKHVYPVERVEGVDALFTLNAEIDSDVPVADDVQLYSVPHDELR